VVFDEGFGEWVCAPMPDGVDEETVEGWVIDGPLDLAPGTTVGGEPIGGPVSWDDLLDVPAELFVDADSFALVSCDEGEILRWDGLIGRFDCAVDLVLDEGTVRAIVAAAPIDLAPGSTVGGVPVVAPT
jgi:hypothetical protein